MKQKQQIPLFTLNNVRCSYARPYDEGRSRVVLEIHDLCISTGQKVFIVGESGIGKSTLLETLGMMNDTAVRDNNASFVMHRQGGDDVDMLALWKSGDEALAQLRRRHFSFIFQYTNLMPAFTAYENVAYTRLLQGYDIKETLERARTVMSELGLEHIDYGRMVHELSGGQQQRLAFARAVLPDFTVLFGDEPTGNLDSTNSEQVMRVIARKLDELKGATAIIVSHDMHLAVSFADVVVKIRKAKRPTQNVDGEDVYYGIIDEDCVWSVDANHQWHNKTRDLSTSDFEYFLRH